MQTFDENSQTDLDSIISSVESEIEQPAAKKKPATKPRQPKTNATMPKEKPKPSQKAAKSLPKSIRPEVAAAVAKAATMSKKPANKESLTDLMSRTVGKASPIGWDIPTSNLKDAESAPIKVQARVRNTAGSITGEAKLSVYAKISLAAIAESKTEFTVHDLISRLLDGKANGIKSYSSATSRSVAGNVIKSLTILGVIKPTDVSEGQMALVSDSPVTKSLMANITK